MSLKKEKLRQVKNLVGLVCDHQLVRVSPVVKDVFGSVGNSQFTYCKRACS